MKYRIEYATSKPCKIIEGCENLIKALKTAKPETVADVRKIYKSGATDSVFETYNHVKLIV